MSAVIRLEYHRPPDRTDIFEQHLVSVESGCHVTLLDAARIRGPMDVAGRTILEDGAPIVWFTFVDAWHDIGRFHTADGGFTGYYANAIRPVTFHDSSTWECTDLYLDVWFGADGQPRVLDEDEFENALAQGWISAEDGDRARMEVDQILAGAAAGVWPPQVCRTWTIERARLNI